MMHMLNSAVNVFSLSLAFTLIGLNIYLSTKVLNITDLTCDASVTIGGCAYGVLVLSGVNPLFSFFISMLLGALAGFLTSSFVTHMNIEPVLSSIITLTALQTFITKLVSVGDMDFAKGNNESVLSTLSAIDNLIIVMAVVSIISVIFFKILNSEYGLAMRVYGDGKIISGSLGINSNQMLWVGLGIGNALSATAGALIVQVTRDFNTGIGNGSLVFGLAAVIIGEKIISPNTVKGAIFGCFVGALIYKVVIEMVTFGGSETLGSEYNSVITAVVLIFLMTIIDDKKRVLK